jgi:hypothetical protein
MRIDLVDAVLGDLEQVLSVEGGSRMRRDGDRAHRPAAVRIEGVEPVAGREPDVPPVEGEPMHALDARKGPVYTDDFGS